MKAARGTPAAGNSRLAVRPLDPEEATALPSIRRVLVSITSGTPLIVPEFEAAALPGDALCSLDETFRWSRVLNQARQLACTGASASR
jgi:hypothetical protein